MKNLVAQIDELSSRRCWEVRLSGEFLCNMYIPCGYNEKEAHWHLVNEWGYSEEITIKQVTT